MSLDILYLSVISPILYFTTSARLYLAIQSLYYLIVMSGDYPHHLAACLFLGYRALYPSEASNLIALGTVISSIFASMIVSKVRYYKPVILITRLIIFPIIVQLSPVFHGLDYYMATFFALYVLFIVLKVLLKGVRDASYAMIKIRGWYMGINTMCIDNVKTIKKVLMQSNVKGFFIEYSLSRSAWLPLTSIESEDNSSWSTIRDRFNRFKMGLRPTKTLKAISQSICEEFITNNTDDIDSLVIQKLVAKITLTWMCGTSDGEVIEDISNACNEWRKHIAVKGEGDMNVKVKAIDSLRRHLSGDDSLMIEGEDVSHIMQPFFISPMINICDIMANISKHPHDLDTKKLIMTAILSDHPFPFLERYVEHPIDDIPANTQVYIPLAIVSKANPSDFLAFSVGSRACPGKNIALALMIPMVETLIKSDKFKPSLHHYHSGRSNDHHIPITYTVPQIVKAIFSKI